MGNYCTSNSGKRKEPSGKGSINFKSNFKDTDCRPYLHYKTY